MRRNRLLTNDMNAHGTGPPRHRTPQEIQWMMGVELNAFENRGRKARLMPEKRLVKCVSHSRIVINVLVTRDI
jgi:hypothetical protein